jgi:hypothetical protein
MYPASYAKRREHASVLLQTIQENMTVRKTTPDVVVKMPAGSWNLLLVVLNDIANPTAASYQAMEDALRARSVQVKANWAALGIVS